MFETYLDLLRLLRQVWRYRMLAAVVTILVFVGGWTYLGHQPDVYRADASLYVDTASMLNRVLDGVALDSTEVDQEFLRVARRTLLSRSNLERIAREAGLHDAVRTDMDRDRLHDALARQITVQAEATRTRGQENLFYLAYDHTDPRVALSVVRAVHDVFIESVLGLTQRDTEKMDTFLTRQIAQYEARLEEAEDRRKRFRQENAGLLPGEGQNYFSILHTAREDLRGAELNLTRAERVRDDLRRNLAAIPGANMGPLLAEGETEGGFSPGAQEALAQMRALQERLADLQGRYTDRHPDVLAARRQLEQLQASIEARGLSLDAAGPALGGDSIAEVLRLQDLRTEFARAQAAVVSERATVEEYRSRMQMLEASVNTIPEVEAEMARLNRDYDIVRRQYEELVSRREAARMSREADLTVDEGIFQVVEAPRVSTTPVAPNRPMLGTLVFGGAFAAGGGLAMLLALLQPTYGDTGQLRDLTGTHVLGRVGLVRSRREKIKRVASISMYGVLILGLCAAYLSLILHYA